MRKTIVSCLLVIFLLAVAGVVYAETPIGYPWSSWGEVTKSLGNTNIDQGLKFDGYLEQGVDWTKISGVTVNTFVGIRGTLSDHSAEYWNNKWGPSIGAKLKLDGKPFTSQSWASTAVGVRYEYLDYIKSGIGSDNRVIVFLQFGLGGDWKK
jgi:hypothetical protein